HEHALGIAYVPDLVKVSLICIFHGESSSHTDHGRTLRSLPCSCHLKVNDIRTAVSTTPGRFLRI
ncbi:MAG: hypothetical protein QW338_01190, partial [Conexivisphaerales archaeon]